MRKKLVLISIGSNIEPEENIPKAERQLKKNFPDIIFSSIYITEDTSSHQQHFYNLAARLTTNLSFAELFAYFRTLEAQLGRVRTEDKNAPRQLDIDICYYDNKSYESKIAEYNYLITPLAEIAPEFIDEPSNLTLDKLKQQCKDLHFIKCKS